MTAALQFPTPTTLQAAPSPVVPAPEAEPTRYRKYTLPPVPKQNGRSPKATGIAVPRPKVLGGQAYSMVYLPKVLFRGTFVIQPFKSLSPTRMEDMNAGMTGEEMNMLLASVRRHKSRATTLYVAS